jgi:hypothetical protein
MRGSTLQILVINLGFGGAKAWPIIMDWIGPERGSPGLSAGFVSFVLCGAEWRVSKCWLGRPSPQCQALLERHRRECGILAGQRSAGPGTGPALEEPGPSGPDQARASDGRQPATT